jgi:hypothetical protein
MSYPAEPSKHVETEILLACARSDIEPCTGSRVRVLVSGGVDWAHLLWIAHRQGMLGLLHRRLESACPDLVPASILDQLRDQTAITARRNATMLDEQFDVLRLFRSNDIPALPLCTPSLLALVYADPGDRPCEPLDILVPGREIERARTLLTERGYRMVYQLNRAQEAAMRRSRGLMLHHDERGIRLHLHDQIAPSYISVAVNPADLWRRRQSVSLDGSSIPRPSTEDLVMILCLNGAIHLWGRLIWLSDLAGLLQRAPSIDWHGLMHRSRRAGVQRSIHLGLLLTHELFGVDLPTWVVEAARADRHVRELAELVRLRLLEDRRGRTGERERLSFRLRVRERAVDRLRYCMSFAVTSSVEDWNATPLPALLFPAYSVLRPVRLAATLAVGATPRRRRAPFMTSPMPVVERMLAMAELRPDDVLYDLGCGDGRIVITAARRYGVRGVGIDLDPRRIAESRANARAAGVDHLVSFVQENALTVDYRPATVVTLWMGQTLNLQLRPRLRQQLRPGARIVGHSFDMGDWIPAKTELVPDGDEMSVAYLWTVAPPSPDTAATEHTDEHPSRPAVLPAVRAP